MNKKTIITLILTILCIGLGVIIWGNKDTGHEGHDHSLHEDHEEVETTSDHECQDEHEEHDDETELRLTAEQRQHFGIVIKTAGSGRISSEISLPGEIVFNEDHVAHIVPTVSGIVRKVNKTIGDKVSQGEIMAIISSRELADAKAGYLAGIAKKELSDAKFQREKTLFEKKVSSEQDYLDAKQAATESKIVLNTIEQKLHALGYSQDALTRLSSEPDSKITEYEVKAPFSGLVTDKHVSLGESLEGNTEIFTVADLSTVWVTLTVYMKDMEDVKIGQEVSLKVTHSGAETVAKISMITPFVNEETRSATARLQVENTDAKWRPGTFVTGHIESSEIEATVVVAKEAVQIIENEHVVFIEHEGAFEIVPVETGRFNSTHIEIISGLEAGSSYVADGAFEIKATVVTSNLDAHAGHGH